MSSLLEEYHPAPEVPQAVANGGAALPSPIPSFQLRRSVAEGIEVELLIQTFEDRILVVVTQNGKVGCLTQASLPAVIPLPQPPRSAPNGPSTSSLAHYPPPPPSLTLTSLLGSPPNRALYETYVAHISTLVWWTLQEVGEARRPVVVGLSLDQRRSAEGGDGDDEGSLELDDAERARFAGVLAMIAEWPGPKG